MTLALARAGGAVKTQIVDMGFDVEQVDKCARSIEAAGDDVTVPGMLRALADAERVAAAARSPMHAAARAASEVPKAGGGAKGSEDSMGESVCCICLDGFENNKALFITECGHKYHFGCIRKYCEKGKETSPSCPLCRQNLPTPPGQSKSRERCGARLAHLSCAALDAAPLAEVAAFCTVLTQPSFCRLL